MILASTLPDGSISFYIMRIELTNYHLVFWVLLLVQHYFQYFQNKLNKIKKKANQSISKAVKFGIFFAIPAFFGILFLSDEIIKLLFLEVNLILVM